MRYVVEANDVMINVEAETAMDAGHLVPGNVANLTIDPRMPIFYRSKLARIETVITNNGSLKKIRVLAPRWDQSTLLKELEPAAVRSNFALGLMGFRNRNCEF